MRRRVTQAGMSVQAIVGSRAVFLAFDLDVGDRDQCLGFAIHRVDHDANPPEQYWLLSFKTFQSVVPNPVASQRYSTFDHPIQSFYWGDYTVRPGAHYTYRVVPRYGQAKNQTSKPGVEVSLDVTTQDPDAGVHGVYFNRGVAASQAYATKFVQPPDQLAPADRDQAMVWLSRGLHEAIVAFIGQANSSQWALRAAVYEFTEPGVLGAFKAAHDQGADVQIVYHAKADSDKADEKTLGEAVAKAKCQVCHAEGDDRKNRNAYGKELAKLLRPEGSRGNERDVKKIDDAFDKVSEMHIDPNDSKSPTYGDLIKHGKLPASESKSADGDKKAAP